MSKYLSDVIDKLKFFTADGFQIHTQNEYSVSWEIIPADEVYSAFISTPKGHFMKNPVNMIVDAFNETSPDVNTGSIYQYEKKKYVLVNEDVDNYIISRPVAFSSNVEYTAVLNVPEDMIAILVLDRNKKVIGHINGKSQLSSLQEYKFTFSDIKNKYDRAYYFRLQTEMTGEYNLYMTENYVEVIVDDAGIINPNVNFYRKQSVDRDFLFDYTNVHGTSKIANEDKGIFTELNKDNKLIYTFTEDEFPNVLFFCYRYDINGKSYYSENRIKITVRTGTQVVSEEYRLIDILKTSKFLSDKYKVTTEITKTGDEIACDEQTVINCYGVQTGYFLQTTIGNMLDRNEADNFSDYEMKEMTSAYYIMSNNVEESEFPYVHINGSLIQSPVSADFYGTTTLIALNETEDNNFEYPQIFINDDIERQEYRLVFRFKNNSETKFIYTNNASDISTSYDYFSRVKSDNELINEVSDEQSMFFTIGFKASEEGCYQNPMGIFIRNVNTRDEHFCGIINIKSETIAEDERFRTLMTNFGIPDPITYPNIFREQEIEEESTDWELINRKSKELFVCYDEIFPYTGTYKALMNAVKFLGYQDLVFKEWYKIKDSNDKNKYVAVQTYDIQTGTAIENMLKNYGVSYGDYERYTKLNRLSMIYHIQNITDEHEEILKINTENGKVDSPYYDVEMIPQLKNVYEYRTSEILAKLYSVKKWLEAYITGVNCYISDINGEGIVLERIKTYGYVTENHYKDIQNIGFFTPNARQQTDFLDSSTIIGCSLNEFTNVTFDDYKDYPIDTFIKETFDVKVNDKKETVYVSAPLGALTVADEYKFELKLENPECGSLYEFTDSPDNAIMVTDNEIKFWNSWSECRIKSSMLPVISIRKGNIRKKNGSWKNNVVHTIKQVKDPKTGNTYYTITDLSKENKPVIRTKSSVMLSALETGASLEYTADNKWQLPLFFMKGYRVTNQIKSDKYDKNYADALNFFDKTEDYVLEIIDGEMKFRNNDKKQSKHCDAASIVFNEAQTDNQKEQQVYITYDFSSDRQEIYSLKTESVYGDYNSMEELHRNLHEYTELNTNVEVPVNRTGSYSVTVKAYDAYNNIFTNKDDDSCLVTAGSPEIDIIINSSESNNSENFYKDNISGELLSDREKKDLIDKCDENQKYPLNYPIYNPEHHLSDNTISYDVISYAIDTPKKNDYILLSNLTERVYELVDKRTLTMKSNNLNKQLLYVENGLVDFVVYNEETNQILSEQTVASQLKSFEKPSGKVSVHNKPDGKLVLVSDISDDIFKYQKEINDKSNHINLYVLSANKMDLRDTVIINNIQTHRCSILSDGRDAYDKFNEDNVVKVSVYHKDSNETVFDNQTAYRIIKKKLVNVQEEDVLKLKTQLILDGNIDISYLDSLNNINVYKFNKRLDVMNEYSRSKVSVVLEPLHQQGVVYTLRADSDAEEKSVRYYENEYHTMVSTFKYMDKQLLFSSYFDDSYSMKVYDYEPQMLEEMWFDVTESPLAQEDTELYMYRNHPVTLAKNRFVIVRPGTEIEQIEPDYKTHWTWKSYMIEDSENWIGKSHKMDKYNVFKSINRQLTIRPDIEGP